MSVWLLAGCQSQENEVDVMAPLLTYQPLEKHFSAPGCSVDRCTKVTIRALEFPNSSALTEQLRERLLALATSVTAGDAKVAEEWEAYAEEFFDLAEESSSYLPGSMASEAQLEASVYAHHDELLVIELTSYVYHAGQAHGLPLTAFMVIDERDKHVVSFEEMIKEGQEEAFHTILNQAHQRWIAEIGQNEQFVTNWPLNGNRNVAPTEHGWVIKYNVYEIAPYAVGQPELHLRTDELEGIAEPRYLNL